MLIMKEGILDEWLDDFSSFNYDFIRFCTTNFQAHALRADFIPGVMEQIHEQWKRDHAAWISEEMCEGTEELSQIKICALLLYNLVSEPFLGNLYSHDYKGAAKYTFRGTDIEKKSARSDIIDAREAVLSLDFVIVVIDWFERNRADRASEFQQPLTKSIRHDILSHLIDDRKDKKAMYLILQSLYL